MDLKFETDFAGPIKMLKGIVDAASKIDQVLEGPVADALRKDFDMQFRSGGYPEPWSPLAPSTIAGKAGTGYPRLNRFGKPTKGGSQGGRFAPENILIRTGDLRRSWTNQSGPDHVCEARNGELLIGSASAYAAYHQSDKPRQKGSNNKDRLPRRPLIITDEGMRVVMERTLDYLLGVKR